MSTATFNVPTRDKTERNTELTTNKVIVRDAAGTEGSVSLSSERFSFVVLEESGTVDSIDQASQLFTGLAKKPPTLLEVLVSMNTRSQKNLLSYSQRRQQKS